MFFFFHKAQRMKVPRNDSTARLSPPFLFSFLSSTMLVPFLPSPSPSPVSLSPPPFSYLSFLFFLPPPYPPPFSPFLLVPFAPPSSAPFSVSEFNLPKSPSWPIAPLKFNFEAKFKNPLDGGLNALSYLKKAIELNLICPWQKQSLSSQSLHLSVIKIC